MSIEEKIKEKAKQLGFDAVGITGPEAVSIEHRMQLEEYLQAGHHGQMGYMQRNFKKRIKPSELMDGAKSAICVAINYKLQKSQHDAELKIANFAKYPDYHDFIKTKLFELAEYINSLTGKDQKYKACVDSAPLLERALAVRAGLGCIGNNHMLINPELGLQLLLGELLCDVQLTPDKPFDGNCLLCGKCVRACPTGALGVDGSFDARKCLSYLTIESQDNIPDIHKKQMDGYIFGCDICMLACPYDKTSPGKSNQAFNEIEILKNFDPKDVLDWTEKEFAEKLKGSCLYRTGLEKLKQNIHAAISKNNPHHRGGG